MINRQSLLSDLQRLLRQLEVDLRERCDEVAEVGAAVRAEYDGAREAERTAQGFEEWRADYITQIAAAWVLSCVFARFLEDNRLVDPPRIAGPGERLRRARDEHELYFRQHPKETDREYLLDVFAGLARLPGGDVFGSSLFVLGSSHPSAGTTARDPSTKNQEPRTNDFSRWLSGDAARALLDFFQRVDPASGELVHDFSDPDWDTRFLGDLYQDLSEAARKKYALLQTPEFIEEFILDRTLDPALEEFGLRPPSPAAGRGAGGEGGPDSDNLFRMIDPACGSGHFLLGSFHRLFDRWCRAEPGTNQRELVQRALNSVHGVDLNPYAVAIARFRLLLVALRACGIERLADAPAFRINLACGDSLLYGTGGDQLVLDFHPLAHVYKSEDLPELRRILKAGHYHAVVANPPYITVKDKAHNRAYRERYSACYRSYSLSVPFLQRIFGLAVADGFTGQITANSFMSREFGKKLVDEVFAACDLTHVVDTSGAYIPGHGTPTVILFGRNRTPLARTVRAVMGIKGEPSRPSEPARGEVWSAILRQIDHPNSESDFVSVSDCPRSNFLKHPWSIGGGGAAELKARLDQDQRCKLSEYFGEIGFGAVTRDDDVFVLPSAAAYRKGIEAAFVRDFITGENVRDWTITEPIGAIWPYDSTTLNPVASPSTIRWLWLFRRQLLDRVAYGSTQIERGLKWFEYSMFFKNRFRLSHVIAFAAVATHNHFVLAPGGQLFNRHSPIIVTPPDCDEPTLFGIVGLLNSSLACFWMKQVLHNRGSTVDQAGARQRTMPFEDFWEHEGTKLKSFPISPERPLALPRQLDEMAGLLGKASPRAVLRANAAEHNAEVLAERRFQWEGIRQQMISLQEELDWQCYGLYGLTEENLVLGTWSLAESDSTPGQSDSGTPSTKIQEPSTPAIELGQRAFEIVMARKMAAGELETTWFERHGSTPITEIPDHWPDDYKRLIERRIELIETDRNIGLIEQPEYKRRWNTEPWDSQLERALRNWLLDRLEGYFDFDGRLGSWFLVLGSWQEGGEPTTKSQEQSTKNQERPPLADIQIVSTARLTDIAARDADFMQVAELYRGRKDFDVGRLVAELVEDESVPCLPVLRYKPAAMDKRRAWERTWELQRLEDRLLAGESLVLGSWFFDEKTSAELERWRQRYPADADSDAEEQRTKNQELSTILSIPVPPKYKSSDFHKSNYWRLRGKLDVPKERWVSFPHCEGEDGTLPMAWAGYDHLQLTQATSAYYVEIQEKVGGSADPRLVPLLGCILEQVPWLKQWHNEIDPEYNMRMGDYFESFVDQEAKAMGLTVQDIREWQPPKRAGRGSRKAAKTPK